MVVEHQHNHGPITKDVHTEEDRIINRWEDAVQQEFKDGVEEARNDISRSQLEELVATGSTMEVMRRLDLTAMEEHLSSLEPILSNINDAGMKLQTQRLKDQGVDALTTIESRRAQSWVAQNAGRMVQDITQETRTAIRQAVGRGISEGLSTQQIAQQVRGSIGLTQRQTAAMSNFRRMLLERDSDVLGRMLDGAERQQARRIIEQGGSLDEINGLTDRYRGHLLNDRARKIARTETKNAVERAKYNQVKDMVDRGRIERGSVVKRWNSALLKTTCAFCRGLHGQTEQMNIEFVGTKELTTKPVTREFRGMVPPLHSRCFCWVTYEVN